MPGEMTAIACDKSDAKIVRGLLHILEMLPGLNCVAASASQVLELPPPPQRGPACLMETIQASIACCRRIMQRQLGPGSRVVRPVSGCLVAHVLLQTVRTRRDPVSRLLVAHVLLQTVRTRSLPAQLQKDPLGASLLTSCCRGPGASQPSSRRTPPGALLLGSCCRL